MQDLPRRTLGRTGLQVTILGFGALELRGMVEGVGRPLMPGQPERILHAVLEAGINYIDVAVDYGEAEGHIGRCIASRRQEFFLASKCGCPLDVSKFSPSERTRFGTPLPRLHDYGRQNIIAAVHQSLRRLKTDYLDVLQFHFSPAKEVLEQEGAIQTLQDLKREGKIRFLGCSSILPNLTDHIGMGVFDVLQIPYSALQPEHEAAIAEAAKAGAGIVIRGGVARGGPDGQGSADVWKLWELAQMVEVSEGISATEFMLRFTITNPDMHTTIVGTLNPAHLQENVAAVLKGPLPDAMYQEAKRRLAAARAALS
ncbi:MAG TPA: aldo/keto reductase [Candidatus Tectomicrobia bacterium]|nr:aldo/keto reductase [Candidatus Tectomicrobia bacterium]